jgi:lytic murein transglycosylase
MEERAEIVARGLRVFACAAVASALAALGGEASLAAPNSQLLAPWFVAPDAAPTAAPQVAAKPAKPAAPPADCGVTPDGFSAWLEGFKQEAEIAGLPPAVIDSALSNVAYDPDVIAHDRRQGSFGQDFETFAAKRVSAYRVRKGRQMLIAYAEPLEKIEKRFGVPGPVLVAIWGLETEFGAGLGNYRTFSTLATLAYDCRRADLFREELVDALKLVARGYMQPDEMRGAWAGEIGQTQLMPSTYLKYATSADGGAIADLVGSSEDALASTANFLKAKGWKRGQGFHEGEPNYAALLEWNAAPVYAKTIALFADRLAESDAQ